MENCGYIIGYDLNENGCQISYYDEEKHELKTLEVAADNYQIPLMVGHYKEAWMFGREAQRAAMMDKGWVVSDLYRKAQRNERIEKDGTVYEARWLLGKFIELTLQTFRKKEVTFVSFTVPWIDQEIRTFLREAGAQAGVDKSRVYAMDYRESFCYYMLYQPKELWQYESALFYCDREKIEAYMLKQLNTDYRREKENFVSVEKVAEAQMEELKAVYPVLNVDKARNADERFRHFIQGVFNKKHVSSVYLTGEGFENNWYPNSQKVLCNGRRAFIGNNLYSKGACYCGLKKRSHSFDVPTYLDETKLMEQVCLKMRIDGVDVWYPIVEFGTHWYEDTHEWEVLLENTEDIEIHIESLATGQWNVETVSFAGMPKRKEYSMKLIVRTEFEDERTCRLSFRDAGFGDFFPATDFRVEKIIHLGGTNGQFNSFVITKKASQPYKITRIHRKIYTIEELCYYLCNNLYLIDYTIMNEKICEWLYSELNMRELAGELLDLIQKKGTIEQFVLRILEYARIYSEPEMEHIRNVLDRLKDQKEIERRKYKADNLLESGEYESAILVYLSILQDEKDESAGERFYGKVYGCLGAAYGRELLYEQAAFMYQKAYEICQDDTMLNAYVYACSRFMQEDEYRKFLEANPSYSQAADRVEKLLEEKDGEMEEAAVPETLERWKHQYRRYV